MENRLHRVGTSMQEIKASARMNAQNYSQVVGKLHAQLMKSKVSKISFTSPKSQNEN